MEEFFADRRPNDLLLVHFSCHGIKDEDGELYFAAANTRLGRLGATAVAAEFVNRRMSRSRSRRVVLLLDCCYAGAFERGMTARAGTAVAIEEQLGGRGRAVITASSAMEYAFEGDELSDTNAQAPSVFTTALVQGLQTGEADRDQDGHVGLDELYDYIYDKVRAATPNQTPGKWSFGVQGELHIARRARPVTTPTPLPPELQQAIDSPLAGVRAGVIPDLERLLHGRHAGLTLAATQVLERFTDDDSRMVAAAATAALGTHARPAPVTPAPSAEPNPPPHVEPTPHTPQTGSSQIVPPTIDRPPPGHSRNGVLAGTSPASAPAQLPAPEPAPPAAAADTAASRTRADRLLLTAGGLAITGALLTFLALFPDFLGDFQLRGLPANTLTVVIESTLALTAGVCIFVPRTRALIGPGFLLGAVATAPMSPVYDITLLAAQHYGSPGTGLWLDLAGGVILMLAVCIAGLTFARTDEVRFAPRRLTGAFPWLVTLLGAAGAIALFVQAQSEQLVPGRDQAFTPGEDLVPLLWATAMALVIPAAAAAALPRRFGVALLAGWIGCGTAAVIFTTGVQGSLFAYTLLALAAMIIPFARTATSQAERTPAD